MACRFTALAPIPETCLSNGRPDDSKRAARLAGVFALGSGEAAAQLTADDTLDGNGLKAEMTAAPTAGGALGGGRWDDRRRRCKGCWAN